MSCRLSSTKPPDLRQPPVSPSRLCRRRVGEHLDSLPCIRWRPPHFFGGSSSIALLLPTNNAMPPRSTTHGARLSCGCTSRPTASARRCAMAGSPCVTYKSIKRVPRRITGCTMPAIPRPNASSSGVNVVTPLAFCVLLPACDGSVRSVVLEFLLATTLWPRRARPPSCAKPSERTTRARSVWLVRFCSIVRSASCAGQKHRARPRRGIVRWDETRLLNFHFQNRVGLVKLRRPREVTQRKEKASQNANRYDPNTFEERMPIPAKIERGQSIGVLRCQRHAWFVGIGRNGRSPQRLGRVNHGKILAGTLHQEVRSQRRRRKNFG